MDATNRDILRIAVPAIVSNVTVPLLGLVDAAISGHLGSASYIGAVAVGGMLFNLMYWLLGFLRMGTSGLTSQALGAGRWDEVARLLRRSMLTGLGLGALLIVLWWPLREVGLWLMQPTDEVAGLTRIYFDICIWGAPAMLAVYALNGWFLGMQDSRRPMIVSVVQNVVNIAASSLFVFVFGMKVEGIALGTVVAQWTGLGVALLMQNHFGHGLSQSNLNHQSNPNHPSIPNHQSGPTPQISRHSSLRELLPSRNFFAVSLDIFLRTLFMVVVMFFFTSIGARQGDTVLAVNSLLLQFALLFSYVMDGFAFAAEAMCGKFYGAANQGALRRTVRRVFVWGAGLVAVFTAVYTLGGQDFLRLLTDEETVVEASADYLPWAALLPVCGVAAFVWDGVFIGTTKSREMLISSLVAALLFFGCFYALTLLARIPVNHALWLSYLLFLLMRGVVQTLYYPRLFLREKPSV
ncbi:MAG: MATE family efflux transporter [Bacteroidaceae bacterium]|nr:MATE family efflux transporter [Bacteroidaceae bacterium]